MGKRFLEVFPDLHITDEMRGLLELVEVERVSAARDRSSIRIYINSKRLIHKKNISVLEKGIREQLFPGKKLTVKIVEKYSLSGQYTPQKLFQVYKDSLLYELKNYSIVEYNIFRKAQCSFLRENLLKMTVENNAVFREKTGELKRILEKIFYERCGLPVDVEYEFVEVSENTLLKQREEQAQREIAEKLRSHPVFAKTFPQGENGQGKGTEGYLEGASVPGTGNMGFSKEAGIADSGNVSGSEDALAKIFFPGKLFDEVFSETSGGNKAMSGMEEASGKTKESWKKPFSKDGKKFGSYQRKSDNPDVLYGRDFEDEFVPINDIEGEMGEVTIRGKIITTDSRLLNSGKTIVIFDITDFTDTITVKLFARDEALEDINKAVAVGKFLKLKGMTTIDKFDGELTIGSVTGMKKCEDFTSQRTDNSLVKRVELHCHTKMSDMDGMSDVKDIIKQVKRWGMPAIAITDHGCVQAFPDASHALEKGDSFKIIYGVEGYLVDDKKQLVENSRNQSFDDPYVVFDIETTGFSPITNRIIEIGAVRV